MKKREKIVYIFPGLDETIRRRSYQALRKILERQGYQVILKNINWQERFSKQLFAIPNDSILIGFSLGAVFAKLLGERNKFSLVILA